jgi:hypothetical protein
MNAAPGRGGGGGERCGNAGTMIPSDRACKHRGVQPFGGGVPSWFRVMS